MRKKALITTVACCALGLALVACVPTTNSATTETLSDATPGITAEGLNKSEQIAALQERSEIYTPETITYEDGITVQRVPDSPVSHEVADTASFDFNVYYLDGNNRGCTSCHTEGLYSLITDKVLGHPGVGPSSIFPEESMTVTSCIRCHHSPQIGENHLAVMMHGIHSRDTFNGTCDSCHVTVGGEMKLWDTNKQDVLNGINSVSAEDVNANFTYDQTTTTDLFTLNWCFHENQINMYDKTMDDEPLDPQVFDTWEIVVSGDVEKPFSMTLPELIDIAPSEKIIASLECVDNWDNGSLVSNCEFTGIPLEWIMEYAGARDDVTHIRAITPQGDDSVAVSIDDMNRCSGGYLVYEVNGERLDWDQGYPCRVIYTGIGAPSAEKWVSEIQFLNAEQASEVWVHTDYELNAPEGMTSNDTSHLIPAVGFTNLVDGQIIQVGQPYEFQGYAEGISEKIVSVEISLDGGETWTKLDSSDSDPTAWVYWRFTWTPELPGGYVMTVRATTVDGNVSYAPPSVLFNAK